jgi:predicted metal-dependent enzyme (double-stranded beta helix superfamily)
MLSIALTLVPIAVLNDLQPNTREQMSDRDWLVTNQSQCLPLNVGLPEIGTQIDWETKPYRLYRFLTDIEDILDRESEDRVRLEQICPLVRRLLTSSEWILTNFSLPNPETGWSVQVHYDEPDFPITVQTVAWSPQSSSSIHNHGSWAIVAMLDGREQNTLWQKSPTPEFPDRIEQIGQHLLEPGDILCLMPEAIHQIEVIGTEPTISFNIYGVTDYDRRFEFDLQAHTATNF